MGDESGQWSVLEAVKRCEGLDDGELGRLLGPFVLVAHATEGGAPGGAWSYATVAAKTSAMPHKHGDDEELSRSIVYAFRKRTRSFPGTVIVGRTSASDVWIDSPEISKLHARMRATADKLFVEDAGSRNGTFVEGERIRKESSVNPGETIRFGSYAVTVYTVASFATHLRRLGAGR